MPQLVRIAHHIQRSNDVALNLERRRLHRSPGCVHDDTDTLLRSAACQRQYASCTRLRRQPSTQACGRRDRAGADGTARSSRRDLTSFSRRSAGAAGARQCEPTERHANQPHHHSDDTSGQPVAGADTTSGTALRNAHLIMSLLVSATVRRDRASECDMAAPAGYRTLAGRVETMCSTMCLASRPTPPNSAELSE